MVEEGIRVCPRDLADLGPNVVLLEVGSRFIEAAEKLNTTTGLNRSAEKLGKEFLDGCLAVGRELSWIGLGT